MTTMSIRASGISREITEMRAHLDKLQRQLGTGQRATDFGGLGQMRTVSISSRARLSEIEGFAGTVSGVTVRVDLMQQTLRRLDQLGSEQRASNLETQLIVVDRGMSRAQLSSHQRLEEAVSLLNRDLDGRFMFSGRAAERQPIIPAYTMIEGEAPRIGLRDLITERRQADLGTAGLGRMTFTQAAPATTMADIAGPFGMKIGGVVSGLSNATVADSGGPAPRTVSVTFTGEPAVGQTFRLALTMPDGSTQQVTLTARAEQGEGGAFAVDPDPNVTSANFNAALASEIQRITGGPLIAASAHAAANDFFEYPPRRMATPGTPATATAYEATDSNSIVVWYQGERGTDDPRATATARVDRSVTVGFGARATENGTRFLIQNLAVFASVTFDPDVETDKAAYADLSLTTRGNLAGVAARGLGGMQASIGVGQAAARAARERHDGEKIVLNDLLSDAEGIQTEEVASQILQLRTRLEASYQTTALISRMSLVNYLG